MSYRYGRGFFLIKIGEDRGDERCTFRDEKWSVATESETIVLEKNGMISLDIFRNFVSNNIFNLVE